jgi:hypothetical protein
MSVSDIMLYVIVIIIFVVSATHQILYLVQVELAIFGMLAILCLLLDYSHIAIVLVLLDAIQSFLVIRHKIKLFRRQRFC